MLQANVCYAMAKKIDAFGKFILNVCCNSLKQFGADEELMKEFIEAAAEVKAKWMENARK